MGWESMYFKCYTASISAQYDIYAIELPPCSSVQVPSICAQVPLALGSDTPSGQTQRLCSPGLDFIPSGQRQRKSLGAGMGTQMWEQGLPEQELLPLRWMELKMEN